MAARERVSSGREAVREKIDRQERTHSQLQIPPERQRSIRSPSQFAGTLVVVDVSSRGGYY